MKIEIVSGSPKKNSTTYRLALFLQKLFKEKTDHEISVLDVRHYPLPLLQKVFSTKDDAPAHRLL